MKIRKICDYHIEFDNGLIMESEHRQDCCENVYADFKYIKQYNLLGDKRDKTIFDIEFNDDFYEYIMLVKGMGFIMIANDYDRSKVFVPCYNIQNGFYNDSLTLLVKKNNVVLKEINLDEYKDDIIEL